MPAVTPVTRPPVPTEATPALLLLHVPPPVASVAFVVLPRQSVIVAGEIGNTAGPGLTVTFAVVKQPVPSV